MDKKERFNKAYNYLRSEGLIAKQEHLAEKMGATRPNVSLALKGNTKVLTDNFLTRFCRAYPGTFNLEWLLSGEGEMLQKQEPETAPIDKQQDALTYAAIEMGKMMAELSASINRVKQIEERMSERESYLNLMEKTIKERFEKLDKILSVIATKENYRIPGMEPPQHFDFGIAAEPEKKKVAK